MEVRNGAGVGTYRGYMGGNSGGVGAALITDAKSRWDASGSIWVGNSGSGTLDVLNGGVVSSAGNGYLAFSNNTTGSATVSGAGSLWSMNDHLYIGGNGAAPGGSGQLVLQNGGKVTAIGVVLYNTGIMTLGANATLSGPLTVLGGAIETANNITFANDFTLGTGGVVIRTNGFNSTFSGAISGSGGLTKSSGIPPAGAGTLTLTGNSTYSGPTAIFGGGQGGKLVVDGSIASAVTINNTGTLGGSGTVGGITINSGGILAPGDSPGILTVNGNYNQTSGGVLNVEIGGATPGTRFDQVAVSGSATVGGTLNLSLVNGFRPIVGQTFKIITSSSENGNFSTINSSGFTVSSNASATGITLTVTSVVPGIPVITSSTKASGTQGQPLPTYQITATDSPTSFGATPLPAGLSVNSTNGIISGTPSAAGNYDVTISAMNSVGTGSALLTLTISAAPPLTPSTLANISTRLRVETGDNVLIAGFIVTGTQPKKVILRAIGPSLPFADRLANPTMELRDADGGLVDSNDNWVDSLNQQAIIDSTIPPTNDLESAILATLPANNAAYTAIVRGVNNGTGIGVVEVYDLDTSASSKLANVATRGLVQTGDNVLFAGMIVVGQTSQKVIIRALGPSVPVPGNLADPTLELHDANGALLEANDNWVDSPNKQAIIDSTIPPPHNLESAIVRTLTPANYTAIVRGVNNTTGIAVVEVYALN
jgi:T5SS/PEP-CTERM-associated repeat protein/autotransporter-associated beta strand protein